MGEANPQTVTWRAFVEAQGAGERDLGLDTDPASLRRLEAAATDLALEADDLREIRMNGEVLLKLGQVQGAVEGDARDGHRAAGRGLWRDHLPR